jgi:hypothetical protein
LIVFFADPRTTVQDCTPFLTSLAAQGFTILCPESGTFFVSSAQAFFFRMTYYLAPHYFDTSIQQCTANTIISAAASISFFRSHTALTTSIYVIADGLAEAALQELLAKQDSFMAGFSGLSDINGTAYTGGGGSIPVLYPSEQLFINDKTGLSALEPEKSAQSIGRTIRHVSVTE